MSYSGRTYEKGKKIVGKTVSWQFGVFISITRGIRNTLNKMLDQSITNLNEELLMVLLNRIGQI